MWPFKKKRKIIGHVTEFQTRKWYRRFLYGEITMEEWRNLPAKDIETIRTPIYADEMGVDNGISDS